jgi:hypothetical protein
MRRKLSARTGAVAIAAVLLAGSFVLPAFGADSPLTIAKRALKKATSADKQVKQLKQQVAALKAQPGPAGPAGAAGPAGSNGSAGAKGDAGAPGSDGQDGVDGVDGVDGDDGEDGEDGAAVRTRARTGGGPNVTVPPGGTLVPIPLTNSTWTQQTGETDQFFVEVQGTEPANCTPGTPGIQFLVKVDGGSVPAQAGSSQMPWNPTPGAQPFTLTWNAGFLIEPPGNAPSVRTLTIEAQQGCAGAGENYTIQSVKINVVAAV